MLLNQKESKTMVITGSSIVVNRVVFRNRTGQVLSLFVVPLLYGDWAGATFAGGQKRLKRINNSHLCQHVFHLTVIL